MIEQLFRWDLDKTYLQTNFESLAGLWRAATEKPEDKRAYPGATPLLAALSNDPRYRLAIVSGSPTVMRATLRSKLELDGIRVHRMTLKPQGKNLLRLRFGAMRDQVGYKLPALLEWRVQESELAPETLVGDDVEMDAFIYAFYGAILEGAVSPLELEAVLEEAEVHKAVGKRCLALMEQALAAGPLEVVERILVHLDKRTAPTRFGALGPKVVPFHNYLQAAAVLYGDGRIQGREVATVAADLLGSPGLDARALASSLQDLVRRRGLDMETAQHLCSSLDEELGTEVFGSSLLGVQPVPQPQQDPLPWLELFRKEKRRAHKARTLRSSWS